MPVPSGNRSRLRTGGGFTISNTRKSIKPASSACHVMGEATNVSSCPATSSITTCEGSFLPQPRASRVAAGIPRATAVTSKSRIAGIRAPAGRCDASSHHSSAVASEAHVPGPGRSRPAPKNVAIRVAQRGAAGPVVSSALARLLGSFVGIVGIAGLRIVQRTGDDMAAAGPLAQVNQRQRSLQKGNSGSLASTIFLQVGHRRLRTRFIRQLPVVSSHSSVPSRAGIGQNFASLIKCRIACSITTDNRQPATDHCLLATVTRFAPPGHSRALR